MFILSKNDFNCINTESPEKVTRKDATDALSLKERVDETIIFIPFVISKSPKISPLKENEATDGIRFKREITAEKKSITPVIFIRLSILFLILKERTERNDICLFSLDLQYLTSDEKNDVIKA